MIVNCHGNKIVTCNYKYFTYISNRDIYQIKILYTVSLLMYFMRS